MFPTVAAATSLVISCICAACTARISASIPVVGLVAAEAAKRVLTVVTSSPPPDFSSAFSASRAQEYYEMASYSALVTVPGAEKGVGVALVPHITAADSYSPRFAAMVAACVILSLFPTQLSRTTAHNMSAVASHSVTHYSLKRPESLAHPTKCVVLSFSEIVTPWFFAARCHLLSCLTYYFRVMSGESDHGAMKKEQIYRFSAFWTTG